MELELACERVTSSMDRGRIQATQGDLEGEGGGSEGEGEGANDGSEGARGGSGGEGEAQENVSELNILIDVPVDAPPHAQFYVVAAAHFHL